MFEARLKQQLKSIFGIEKVTYDTPSDSREQEALFIEVESAMTRLKDGRQIARVTGKLRVFAQANKLPYGFFSKRLAEADQDDLVGLFFFDFEENRGTFQNIAERGLSFIYLFDSQYDPAIGTLTSIDLEISET